MKEMEIEVNGKKVKVTIRKVTYGEYNKIMQSCAKTTMVGGQMRAEIDAFKFQQMLVEKSATLSEGKLDDLPMELGMQIESEVMQENGMGDSGASFRSNESKSSGQE